MKTSLSWKAPEFVKRKKKPIWFILFFLIIAALIFLAIKWKAFTMVIFFILAGFLILIYAIKEPQIIDFSVGSSGVKIDKKLYKYSEIDSFWIFYDPPEIKELSLKFKKMFFPVLSIPLADTDPNKVRKILIKFIPEEEQKESVAENIARHLNF